MEVGNGGQLGLHPDATPKIDNSMKNNEDHDQNIDSSPPNSTTTPKSPSRGPNNNIQKASDLLMAVSVCSDINKTKIKELAVTAMEELIKMAIEREEPLWNLQEDGKTEILNGCEYMREFGQFDATLMDIVKMVEVGDYSECLLNLDSFNIDKLSSVDNGSVGEDDDLRTEGSREKSCVPIEPVCLVDLLMDLKQWSTVFSNMVARARVLGVLSSTTDVGENYDRTLQVMTAEFYIPTPLVQSRESYFARYCKKLNQETWGVVDISLENLFPYPSINFRRKPSGCLIQQLQNGWSQVIWVEHVEVDNRMVPNIFQPLVSSGFAFGAKRWVASIIRHCEKLSSLRAQTTPTIDGILIPQVGRTSLLKLSERMMRSFCFDISSCSPHLWMPPPISGVEDVRLLTKNIILDPGKRTETAVVFATSLWIPSTPMQVFDLLRHESSRNKWDILSHGYDIQELAYVIYGDDPRNRVSIIQANAEPNELVTIFYLQESYTDSTGSYVIYAPMDIFAVSTVLNGGNPEEVAILPSGFSILPGRPLTTKGEEIGSVLTIGFQIIDSASTEEYVTIESVETTCKIIVETELAIKSALISDNLLNSWGRE